MKERKFRIHAVVCKAHHGAKGMAGKLQTGNHSKQIKRHRGCPLAEGLERRPPSELQSSELKERRRLTRVRLAGLEKSLETGIRAPLYRGLILSFLKTDHTYFPTATGSAPALCPQEQALNKYLLSE